MADQQGPLGQAHKLYETLEARVGSALESVVAGNAFAELLATSATNAMGVSKLVNDAVDQAVRATRLAVRQDILGLAKQQARTEDKLERLLQLVEELQAQVDTLATKRPVAAAEASARNGSAARARVRAAPRRQETT
jgi:outer membrane murein-binding lipoprotein Lpp